MQGGIMTLRNANTAELEMSEDELLELKRKFISGPGHIFNPTPTSHDEAVAHGNALARSGNYPVGTSDCFNVGISGGCGTNCFVYLEGRCDVSSEMIPRLEKEEVKLHYELYPNDKKHN